MDDLRGHFGTKQNLVEEVVAGYVEGTLLRFSGIWADEKSPLDDKIRNSIELNRERYLRCNPGARVCARGA